MNDQSQKPAIFRICYSKTGKIRFISHRDTARVFERALKRAGVPVAYTQGFSPRPRLSFGFALPTGYESMAEYLDIDIKVEQFDSKQGRFIDRCYKLLQEDLSKELPEGMKVSGAALLEGRSSLQSLVQYCTWVIRPKPEYYIKVGDWMKSVLELSELRVNKGKNAVCNMRTAISAFALSEGSIFMELSASPNYFKPTDLLSAHLDADLCAEKPTREDFKRIMRLNQWTVVNGEKEGIRPFAPIQQEELLTEEGAFSS